MKMHISPAQLQELTDEQKERLREWWAPQTWDICCIFEKDSGEFVWKKVLDGNLLNNLDLEKIVALPLLSIGQCIELLGAKLLHINHYHKQWQVSFLREQKEEELFITELYADDLIDALWQAVKEVL